MSTNARIVVENPDHTFDSIYLHWDGSPDSAGQTLIDHYNTPEKVASLLDLGGLSVLGDSTDCPDGHSYNSPVAGYCVAYGRDRGETGVDALRNEKRVPAEEQYTYLFKNNSWYVMQTPTEGVLLQSILQENLTESESNTITLPEVLYSGAEVEEIKESFKQQLKEQQIDAAKRVETVTIRGPNGEPITITSNDLNGLRIVPIRIRR